MAEKVIAGKTYRAEKLKVREAVRLQLRLGKTLGPALPALAAILAVEDEVERDRRSLDAIGTFFATANPGETESLIFDLCEMARVQVPNTGHYEPVVPEQHFDDAIVVYQVAIFVIGAQFAGFTDAVLRLSAVMRTANVVSPNPTSAQ